MTFETLDHSYQKTWPYPKIPTFVPTYLPTYPPTYLSHFWFLTLKSKPRDLWPLRQLFRVMRRHDLTKKDLPTSALWIVRGNGRSQLRHKTILETCNIWDTDYNSDNWEPEFMTICFTFLQFTFDQGSDCNKPTHEEHDNKEWQRTAFAILAMFSMHLFNVQGERCMWLSN